MMTVTNCKMCGQEIIETDDRLISDNICGKCKQEIIRDKKAYNNIKDSGDRTEFNTGAVRDMHEGKGRYDLLQWTAINEIAKHLENGAIKYGERNWEKGIELSSYIDSAVRHISKYMQGQKDEPHLVAAAWNLLCAIQTEILIPEMQNIPSRLGGKDNE